MSSRGLFGNPNLTIKKLIWFAGINGIGTLLFMGLQYPMLNFMKAPYVLVTLVASGIVLLVKFVLMGVFTYKK